MPSPVIAFLSDYGHADEFVGVCHGVIAKRAPSARVIDLTHSIPRHDVRAGALVLRGTLAYTPAQVHLAVVDPEVGALGINARRAITHPTRNPGKATLEKLCSRIVSPVSSRRLIEAIGSPA